jgi:hypothetical protein
MGVLHCTSPELWIPLAPHAVLGRSGVCHPRLHHPQVSSEHLSLTWRDGVWKLRDLGSRNGTTVNGVRVPAGEERLLERGDTLGLGALTLEFVDASGPEPCARRLPGAETRSASGGVLALPDEARPLLTVFQGAEGEWIGERDGQEEEVLDGDVVALDGEAWMLHLPRGHVATQEARATAVALEFAVSPDEEAVELRVRIEAAERVLDARAHYYTLLTLARARLHDVTHGRTARAGWRSVAELCHLLRCDENKLNVDIFRCRQDLGRCGLAAASSVVERRRTSRELRFRPEVVIIRRRDP